MILHPLSIDYSQSGKLILTFEFNVGDGPSLTYVASDANILSFDGCEVADFDEPIVPFVGCEPLSGGPGGSPSELTILFDTTSLPDLDTALLTDFLFDDVHVPISIDYTVAGEITLTFSSGVVFSNQTVVYTASSSRLSFDTGQCEVADFSLTITGPI